MKDIISYRLFESEDIEAKNLQDPKDQKPQEAELKGYVTFLELARIQSTAGTSYPLGGKYIHIAENLWEVIENLFTKTEYVLKNLDWQSQFWDFMTDPIHSIPRFIDSKSTDVKCLVFRICTGFTPSQQKNTCVQLSNNNPYNEVFALNFYLQNPEKKLREGLNLLTSEERDLFKNEDELKQLLLTNPTLSYLLDSRPEDKQRLIKELGIKDLSKIGKGLNLGLI